MVIYSARIYVKLSFQKELQNLATLPGARGCPRSTASSSSPFKNLYFSLSWTLKRLSGPFLVLPNHPPSSGQLLLIPGKLLPETILRKFRNFKNFSVSGRKFSIFLRQQKIANFVIFYAFFKLFYCNLNAPLPTPIKRHFDPQVDETTVLLFVLLLPFGRHSSLCGANRYFCCFLFLGASAKFWVGFAGRSRSAARF